MVEKKGHIIFDFDGTMVSNIRALKNFLDCEQKDFGKVNLSNFDFSFKISSFIKNLGKITSFFSHYYETYEGIPELLEDLRRRGHCLYIWTLRDQESTEKILEHLELRDYFKIIKGTGEGQLKPQLNGLLTMVGHLGPERVIVIGDGLSDLMGSKNFGCSSIYANWGTTLNPLINQGQFSYVANHPRECLEHIDNYFEKLVKKSA